MNRRTAKGALLLTAGGLVILAALFPPHLIHARGVAVDVGYSFAFANVSIERVATKQVAANPFMNLPDAQPSASPFATLPDAPAAQRAAIPVAKPVTSKPASSQLVVQQAVSNAIINVPQLLAEWVFICLLTLACWLLLSL